MAQIKILTDSTSDIPANAIKKYGIEIIPVNIVLNGKTYRDGIDITPQNFYGNIENYDEMYSEAVRYEDYALKYKKLTYECDELIIIHCSKELSKTYENAVRVHEDFKNSHKCKVEVIDSKQCSMGLGLMVIAAARAAQEGKRSDEVLSLIESYIPNTSVFLAVPSLKYLRKGKKISGLKSLIGTAVGLKPVLAIEDGKLAVKSKLFGQQRNMMLEMLDFITKDIGNSPIELGITHAGAEDLADELKDVFKQKFDCNNVFVSYTGPSIGINTGPKATGIMYYKHGR
jgi:DegV family protein with EDD domain